MSHRLGLQKETRLAINERLALIDLNASVLPSVAEVDVGAGVDNSVGKGVDVRVNPQPMALVMQGHHDYVGLPSGFSNVFV